MIALLSFPGTVGDVYQGLSACGRSTLDLLQDEGEPHGKTAIQEAEGRATKKSMKDLVKVHVDGVALSRLLGTDFG